MEIAYSESILASYVTYKELYSNENYRSAYQILAEFIKYIISKENIYNFSIPELNKKMRENFGFVLPNAVIKSAVKKLDFIEKIEHSEQYGVNGKSVYIDKNFCQYKEKAEKINSDLMEKQNMMTNPFEKFERKRFLYHSEDLGVISMNHALFSQMEEDDFRRVEEQMREDLKYYYNKLKI